MNRRQFLLVSGGLLATGTLVAGAGIRRSFHTQMRHETDALLRAAQPVDTGPVSDADLEALPLPVQRWLRASGVVGTKIPSVVRLTQDGEFRLGADKPWMPMTATQYYTTNPPGFLWQASMRMFPLVHVAGRDRYTNGVGDIDMRIASLFPVASQSGGNLNGAALLRYLNETMWFPAALVRPNVTWAAIDDTSARATLTDAGHSVSAVFAFDADNRLATMTADRWNDAEQAVLPWSTPVSDYRSFEGVTVPTTGEGIWKTGDDAYTYVRLHVTGIDYDPA